MRYVNSHIHSPFSFSPFDTIEQAVRFAAEENVAVLGINDCNTVEGYDEFYYACRQYRIYPIFGIELVTFSAEDKAEALRWNDPVNAGIVNICGKGLRYPAHFSTDMKNSQAYVWKSLQDRIWTMILKLNELLQNYSIDISLDYNTIRKIYARTSVCEHHIAKALYLEFVKKWRTSDSLINAFRLLFQDQTFNADVADVVVLQNEIEQRLFRPGGGAYIEYRKEHFFQFRDAHSMILSAGGIPCYPLLLDEAGSFTEFESSCGKLHHELLSRGFYAIECISNKVSFESLKQFALYFRQNDFIVTFGTDHNTVEQGPLIPATRGNRQLDNQLLQITYDGACMIVAHQELTRKGQPGFVNENGDRLVSKEKIKDFIRIGDEIIRKINEATV
ncbi:MAG TPA: PHP domain-containing protein [Chitinispirillaceae bacterium]|nr:PHP domain-containing protein [Chitinispirillaceae bacterium]